MENPLNTPGISLNDYMGEAGLKILRFYMHDMGKGESPTRNRMHPKSVYQMRVAVRRMRSALKVFGKYYPSETLSWVQKGLRKTGRELGAVRDLDVFLKNTAPYVEAYRFEGLQKHLQTQRIKAQDSLNDYLSSGTYTKFMKRFGHLLNTQIEGDIKVRHRAASELYRRFEAIREFDIYLNDPIPETLHDLRIAGKEFRYTLAFFEDVLGPEVAVVLVTVQHMQDHLGALNDAHFGQDLVVRMVGEMEHGSYGEIERYLAFLKSEVIRLQEAFPAYWAALMSAETRQNLAMALSVI